MNNFNNYAAITKQICEQIPPGEKNVAKTDVPYSLLVIVINGKNKMSIYEL